MGFRLFDARLTTGFGAALAGGLAHVATEDPVLVIGAASIGAIATAFLAIRAPSGTSPSLSIAEPPAPSDAPHPGGLAPGQGRALLEHLPMGVMLIDRRGTIIFANHHAGEIFGGAGLLEHPFSILRSPKLVDAIEGCLYGAPSSTVEFARPRVLDIHMRAHVLVLEPDDPDLPDERDAAVLVVVEDVTALHRTLALHRDFIANASHELKTPLSSITGIIQTVLGHARDDPQATERFLGMMASQTDRMRRLVEDLLSLNRIELNERIAPRDPQSVMTIVAEVADALQQAAEDQGMNLTMVPPTDPKVMLSQVRGDREELAQVFRNLVENAIKYGLTGTEVAITTRRDGEEHPGMIGVSVRDHGHGIAREHLPRLTERFYRVSVSRSREKGGTGLGLAIVKHILNRHRGELEIESAEGEGSTFTVWLPIFEAEAVTGAKAGTKTRTNQADAA